MMGAAAILKKSMTDTHLLQQKVKYRKEDIVFWSPIRPIVKLRPMSRQMYPI
jgi:hypothetical protein